MKYVYYESWIVLIQLSFFVLCLSSCESTSNTLDNEMPLDSSQWVISEAINAHGKLSETYNLSFNFRNKVYNGKFDKGNYTLSRAFTVNDTLISDTLTNSSFNRTINGISTEVPTERKNAFSNSINSVFYFALLPWKLNDAAVQANYLGVVSHSSGKHYAIKVSFSQEGGGEDFEDEFVYWFNTNTFLLDYLAYSYNTDGRGIRFRSVDYRHKTTSGQVFQDYKNYKPKSLKIDLQDLLHLYNNQDLVHLSNIRLEKLELN